MCRYTNILVVFFPFNHCLMHLFCMHVDLVLFVNSSHPLFSTAGFACECSVVLQLMFVMICTHAVVAAGFRVSLQISALQSMT